MKTGLKEMLAQAQVASNLIDGLIEQLEAFAEPFAAALSEPEQRRTLEDVGAALGDSMTRPARRSPISTTKRQGLQKFIGHAPWEHQPCS